MAVTYLMSSESNYKNMALEVADGFIDKWRLNSDELYRSEINSKLKLSGKNVIVVDDDEILGNRIVKILTKLRSKVTYFSNSIEAYDVCNNWNADIILLDIRMPGINGFDICKKLGSGVKNE
jgi:PleD family two-component response regulator